MKVAFPTDEHFPYQDEAARSVALQIVSDFDPDIRVSGSDGMDFYTLSKFDKNPERIKTNLQGEISLWARGQREWNSAAPNASALWLPGNHEDRLRRWIWAHPTFYGLRALEWQNLLLFDELGIKEAPGGEIDLFGKLLIRHGNVVRKFSAYTANAELGSEFFSISTLTGHTHRGGTTYATTRTGLVQGVEGFCLCNLDPEYVNSPNWQQGIVLVNVTPDTLSIEPVPFFRLNNEVHAIWRDKDYVE